MLWNPLKFQEWAKRTFKEQKEVLGIKNIRAEMKHSIEELEDDVEKVFHKVEQKREG